MNPRHHAIAQKENSAAARTGFLADLHATFDTPPGQASLRALRAAAGLPVPAGPWGPAIPARRGFVPTAAGAGACPYLAAAVEGRRSLVEDLESWLAEPREGIAPPAVTGGPSTLKRGNGKGYRPPPGA